MWWRSKICKFEEPNCKVYSTHLVKRISKVSSRSTTPTPRKDFLARQSPHFTILQIVYTLLAQKQLHIKVQICWIIFLDPPHTKMKYHNDIMHHHIFSYVYFGASLNWRNHVQWCYKNNNLHNPKVTLQLIKGFRV